MSLMNILSATLIILILGAGLTLVFGRRSASAAVASPPTLALAPVGTLVAPDV
ncbi:MAG: hypothetical protein JKY00_08665 [Roseicyclus sp.]|nr:hypothetical protein [Roseicyclus sp.]